MCARGGYVEVREQIYGRHYALKFKVDGKRYTVSLGRERDGWTEALAEEERQRIADEIASGTWAPPPGRFDRGHGYVACQPMKHGRLFYLVFKVEGERHCVGLGREKDGWTHDSAEEIRRQISGEIDARTWQPPVRRGTDPVDYTTRKCREAAEMLAAAIASFERRTGKEAPPQLTLLKTAAESLGREEIAA